MAGWLSNRTLDEIAWLDGDQYDQVLKHAKMHGPFSGRKEVDNFVFRAVDASLRKLGVEIHKGMDPRTVEMMMRTKKIRMETREYAEVPDRGKTGIYIYTGSLEDGTLTLAYWISYAVKAVHRLVIEPSYWIRTNAPV